MQPIPSLSPLASAAAKCFFACSHSAFVSIIESTTRCRSSNRSSCFIRAHSTWWCDPSFHDDSTRVVPSADPTCGSIIAYGSLSPGAMVIRFRGQFLLNVGSRDLLVVQKISLIEITSTVVLLATVVVDLSRVFHAIDSSYTSSYPQAHTCSLWNASCTSCAANADNVCCKRKTVFEIERLHVDLTH